MREQQQRHEDERVAVQRDHQVLHVKPPLEDVDDLQQHREQRHQETERPRQARENGLDQAARILLRRDDVFLRAAGHVVELGVGERGQPRHLDRMRASDPTPCRRTGSPPSFRSDRAAVFAFRARRFARFQIGEAVVGFLLDLRACLLSESIAAAGMFGAFIALSMPSSRLAVRFSTSAVGLRGLDVAVVTQ